MQPIGSTINVATLEADICLHYAWAVRAFHVLWYFSTGLRNVNAATNVSSVKNLVMVLSESEFEALLAHKLLPLVKVLQDLQNSCSMTTEHHA